MRTKKDNSSKLARRNFLAQGFKVGAASLALPAFARAVSANTPVPAPEVKPFELDELTLAALQDGMKSGKYTARSLAEKYLARIGDIDTGGPALNSVIELNHEALAIADSLDAERQSKGPRGPAPRNPGPDQGQHRHRGSHDDHRRLSRASRIHSREGFGRSAASPRIRRVNSGQDESQ